MKPKPWRGKEVSPGALPNFQNGAVPAEGLQEGFCALVGNAIVGQSGKEVDKMSYYRTLFSTEPFRFQEACCSSPVR